MTLEELHAMRKQLNSQITKLAKPINYSDLIKRGIISKAGTWYRVHVPLPTLPEYITCKIYHVAQDSKGIKVKFYRGSAIQRSVNKLKRLGFGATKKGTTLWPKES